MVFLATTILTFTGKHLHQSLLFLIKLHDFSPIQLYQKETPAQVLRILRNFSAQFFQTIVNGYFSLSSKPNLSKQDMTKLFIERLMNNSNQIKSNTNHEKSPQHEMKNKWHSSKFGWISLWSESLKARLYLYWNGLVTAACIYRSRLSQMFFKIDRRS